MHAWTFRNEQAGTQLNNNGGNFTKNDVQRFIDPRFDGNFHNELAFFDRLGVDGFICDYPGSVRQFVNSRFAGSNAPTVAEEVIVS